MTVIRPVSFDDLDALVELATLTGFGLTTLPRDREFLHKRISDSQRSFGDDGRPARRRVLPVRAGGSRHGPASPAPAGSSPRSAASSRSIPTASRPRFTSRRGWACARRSACCTWSRSTTARPRSAACSCARLPRRGQRPAAVAVAVSVHGRAPQCFDPMVIAEMRGVIDEQGARRSGMRWASISSRSISPRPTTLSVSTSVHRRPDAQAPDLRSAAAARKPSGDRAGASAAHGRRCAAGERGIPLERRWWTSSRPGRWSPARCTRSAPCARAGAWSVRRHSRWATGERHLVVRGDDESVRAAPRLW